MKYLPLIMLAACMIACSSPQKKAAGDDTTAIADTLKTKSTHIAAVSNYAFLRLQDKDTTHVDFTLVDDHVQGLMDWFPNGKEGHSGVIEGTLKNDTIHAVWGFAVGRETDTIKVEFLFKDSTDLRQKPLMINTKNGRLQTNTKAGFTLRYKQTSKAHR